jgi:hypothetical protein
MRTIAQASLLLAVLILPAAAGCSILARLFDMEERQREWVGDPASGNPRFSEQKMNYQAELDRIYD